MDFVNEVKSFREFIMNIYDSNNTANGYGSAVLSYLFHFKKRPQDITAQEIIQYCLRFENLSTRRNIHSAIKLFYKFKASTENRLNLDISHIQKSQTLFLTTSHHLTLLN